MVLWVRRAKGVSVAVSAGFQFAGGVFDASGPVSLEALVRCDAGDINLVHTSCRHASTSKFISFPKGLEVPSAIVLPP